MIYRQYINIIANKLEYLSNIVLNAAMWDYISFYIWGAKFYSQTARTGNP